MRIANFQFSIGNSQFRRLRSVASCSNRTGSPTRSNFDFAGPLTEAVLLGSACVRNRGDKLDWDSKNLKITNDPEANRFLHYEYRKGWEL